MQPPCNRQARFVVATESAESRAAAAKALPEAIKGSTGGISARVDTTPQLENPDVFEVTILTYLFVHFKRDLCESFGTKMLRLCSSCC